VSNAPSKPVSFSRPKVGYFSNRPRICIGLHVKFSLYLSDLNEIRISRQIFDKNSNIKCHENTCNGNRVVPCGQTDKQA